MQVWEIKFVLSVPVLGKWARKKRDKWVFEDDPNNLTMNARMPIEMLAENVGIPPRRAAYLKASLERNLNISYIPDVRLTKIGFLEFMIFVKFTRGSPEPNFISHTCMRHTH